MYCNVLSHVKLVFLAQCDKVKHYLFNKVKPYLTQINSDAPFSSPVAEEALGPSSGCLWLIRPLARQASRGRKDPLFQSKRTYRRRLVSPEHISAFAAQRHNHKRGQPSLGWHNSIDQHCIFPDHSHNKTAQPWEQTRFDLAQKSSQHTQRLSQP